MLCIETKSLFKKYNSINAVDGIDLNIESGQVFGFLGPNGAGKSTVIKLLTTLIQPTKGQGISSWNQHKQKPFRNQKKNWCNLTTTKLRANTIS